jgi:Thoeris protein ThsB, TIR-like domain
MAKRVFFSFHYQDVIDFRANVVRQHWLTKPDREAAGFFDASVWGNAKLSGDVGIKRVINGGLEGTSVTCVLIGSETYRRRWVRYEILKSFRRGNSLLAVHINSIKGRDQRIKPNGFNPLSFVGVTYSESGLTATLWEQMNGEWKEYSEIDSSSSYQTNGVGLQYRGKGFKLAQWYPVYDWVAGDGYNNFSRWVG